MSHDEQLFIRCCCFFSFKNKAIREQLASEIKDWCAGTPLLSHVLLTAQNIRFPSQQRMERRFPSLIGTEHKPTFEDSLILCGRQILVCLVLSMAG